MTTFGIMMCKDEIDVIEGVVRHMADEVDHLIVADNGSTDGTRDVLASLADELPLTVTDDPDPAYYQGLKMSALAAHAGSLGARWIVPFDADEIWYADDRVGVTLSRLSLDVVEVPLFNHYPTGIDELGTDPFRTITWRMRSPGALPKVAFRWREGACVHQGNHGVSLPGDGHVVGHDSVKIRHFSYRSTEQFVRKARNGAAAYRAADNLPLEYGAHWRAYGEILERHGEEALSDVFRCHFWYLSPIDSGLVHDPAPYMRWRT